MGRRTAGGVGVGRQGAGEWREGRPGATPSVWGGRGSLGQPGQRGFGPLEAAEEPEPSWRDPRAEEGRVFSLPLLVQSISLSAPHCSQASSRNRQPRALANLPVLHKQGVLLFLDTDGYWFPFP